ncbi:hypothetical protein BCR42DRAFT_419540 [Absidia repens]|uniref:Uncharacterized protein n=1 Tax=Absidia repens TaxID=90262 RepID=A0A1X2IBJ6_9FUNG|nr:hypothetical protein BCR42DRAFT_419540 [Absidia repens]
MPFSQSSKIDGNSEGSRSSSELRTSRSKDDRPYLRLEEELDWYAPTLTTNQHINNTNCSNIDDETRKQLRDGNDSGYSKRKHVSSSSIPISDGPGFTSTSSKQIKRLDLSSSAPSLFEDNDSDDSIEMYINNPTASKRIKWHGEMTKPEPSLYQDGNSIEDYLRRTTIVPSRREHQNGESNASTATHLQRRRNRSYNSAVSKRFEHHDDLSGLATSLYQDDDSDDSIDTYLKRTTATTTYEYEHGSDSRDIPCLQQKQSMIYSSTRQIPQNMLGFDQLFEEPDLQTQTRTQTRYTDRRRRKKEMKEEENAVKEQGKPMVLNELMTMLQAISQEPIQESTDLDEEQGLTFFEEQTLNDNEESLVNGFGGFSDDESDKGG